LRLAAFASASPLANQKWTETLPPEQTVNYLSGPTDETALGRSSHR
jgi:hypothetical protein